MSEKTKKVKGPFVDEKAKTAEDPQIQIRKCIEYLPCKFTNDERVVMSEDQARTYQDLQELEDRKKEIVASFAADAKKLEAIVASLARKISTGYEHRNVPCEWRLDFREITKTLVRLDTGEIVKTEELSQSDLQSSLELAEKGKESDEVFAEKGKAFGDLVDAEGA